MSYGTYVAGRLEGFGGASANVLKLPEEADFPEFFERLRDADPGLARPACVGPVRYGDIAPLEADIANLQAALTDADTSDAAILSRSHSPALCT